MSVSAHENMCVYVGQKSTLLFSLTTLYLIFWDRISPWDWSSPIQLDRYLDNPYELTSTRSRDTFRDLQVSRCEFRNWFPLRAWQYIHVWFLLLLEANSGSKRQATTTAPKPKNTLEWGWKPPWDFADSRTVWDVSEAAWWWSVLWQEQAEGSPGHRGMPGGRLSVHRLGYSIWMAESLQD